MSAPIEHSSAEAPGALEPNEHARSEPITAQRVVAVGGAAPANVDREFVAVLRSVSLLRDLDAGELGRLLERIESTTERARQLDLLELYFAGATDAEQLRRVQADRFLLHHASSTENAHAIVRRIATLAPELDQPTIERIGTDDGPLVMRAGEHFCAIVDEYDDPSDEVALSDVEAQHVTVRALVRAANVLLQRAHASRRFVLLRCDGQREAFCALDDDGALALSARGLLEERSATRLLEFCCF